MAATRPEALWHITICRACSRRFHGSVISKIFRKNRCNIPDEHSSFHGSLKTVSKELVADTKILAKEEFLNKYGHLRPKTYDINSPNYSENFEEYFPHGMPMQTRSEAAEGTNDKQIFAFRLPAKILLQTCSQSTEFQPMLSVFSHFKNCNRRARAF